MTDVSEDGTHTTLGRRFRTPAHSDVLAALGRALFSFVSLEETVTAILYEAGAASLPKARAKMAGAKEAALQTLPTAIGASSTAGEDSAGNYLPGLAYTTKDGQSWKTISRSPDDLLDLAVAVEGALDPVRACLTRGK